MEVHIHPSFDPYYYGFYVVGLRRVFGASALRYDDGGFPRMSEGDAFFHLKDTFAFTVRQGENVRRVYLSADDRSDLSEEALEWCDVYAKVNVAPEHASEPKLLPIGPSFGVRAWSTVEAVERAARTLMNPSMASNRKKYYAREYLRQRRRRSESDYGWRSSSSRHLFFAAWAWHKHAEVNRHRATYLRTARELAGVELEGGFAPRRRNDLPELDGLYAPRFYSHREYLEKTRRSFAVFNAPAVHGCLGWKLGEFLALGKAIVSLPLGRVVPVGLAHGEAIHFVEPTRESIRRALERLRDDVSYRRRLEHGALSYYKEHLAPEAVVRRIVQRALQGDAA